MLLRFRVANHRSIRDEQELSLVAVPKRGEPKDKGEGAPPTVRVAGIYGANASGKSSVLDAMRWMQNAVRASHTEWKPAARVRRSPFLLDDSSKERPSFYEVDFIHEGVRHNYGFEIREDGIVGEWLFVYPKGRAQRLFERFGHEEDDYRFGRALTGEVRRIQRMTRGNALYLSVAASNDHARLLGVYRAIVEGMDYASHRESEEKVRLNAAHDLLKHGEISSTFDRLVRVADLGVTRVDVEKKAISDEEFNRFVKLVRVFDPDGDVVKEGSDELSRMREGIESRIVLVHSADGGDRRLDLDQESAGTRVWLSLIVQVLSVVLRGGVFLVDEIDSSMHPMLSSTLIKMFKDPEINPKGAQLIFASHDTTLLGSLLRDDLLRRDEVWFTEKDRSGATSLYSLADFRPRGTENAERGYLQGRYGAVPFVDFADIRSVIIELHRGGDGASPEGEEGNLPEQAGA